MQVVETEYDVAFIGGGLAGLAGAIQCAKAGFKVVLVEKEKYPFHKVCGEYISMESFDFLSALGVPLAEMSLPQITSLQITAPNGKEFMTKLPLGGFGISRYKLDAMLAQIARDSGVAMLEETKASDIIKHEVEYTIKISSKLLNINQIGTKVICCSYGKRSNLDIKWKRNFINKNDPGINNYVGVKYHIRTDWPTHLIGLHNFKDGYCGISKIEDENYCLCYLTKANNLKASNNSIQEMQQNILFQNPVLKKIFASSDFLFQTPVTISQISFSKKSLVENGALMLGDAAGMITPLCGNGMSMALHSSKMATSAIKDFLSGSCSKRQMEETYRRQWKKEFESRMHTGRILQGFFGSPLRSNLFVSAFKAMPFLSQSIIKKTHGKPF